MTLLNLIDHLGSANVAQIKAITNSNNTRSIQNKLQKLSTKGYLYKIRYEQMTLWYVTKEGRQLLGHDTFPEVNFRNKQMMQMDHGIAECITKGMQMGQIAYSTITEEDKFLVIQDGENRWDCTLNGLPEDPTVPALVLANASREECWTLAHQFEKNRIVLVASISEVAGQGFLTDCWSCNLVDDSYVSIHQMETTSKDLLKIIDSEGWKNALSQGIPEPAQHT